MTTVMMMMKVMIAITMVMMMTPLVLLSDAAPRNATMIVLARLGHMTHRHAHTN